jgi:Flp pilus assembly protein TadG
LQGLRIEFGKREHAKRTDISGKRCSAMAVPRIPSRVKELVYRFRRDRKANVAVMFGIAVIPVLGMVGAATDYSLATQMKAKLSSSADSAAVAWISHFSAGWTQAMSMTTTGYVNLSVSSTVTKTGGTLNSSVQWSAQVLAPWQAILPPKQRMH